MTTPPKAIIFTDLDGTLLDRETYSFEPAQSALHLIKQKGIPLILSTSKTRAEIELYRKRLENKAEDKTGVFLHFGFFYFNYLNWQVSKNGASNFWISKRNS